MDARSSAGEPRVLINRDALLHNARVIRKAVGPEGVVCAVIKADCVWATGLRPSLIPSATIPG